MSKFLEPRLSEFIFVFSFENFNQTIQTIMPITFAIIWHLFEEIEEKTHIEQ